MTQTTIRFGIDSQSYSGRFRLELDNDRNAGLSAFEPGQPCYLRLFPAGENPRLETNMGSARLSGTRLPLEIEEDIVFANSDRAQTRYPIEDIGGYEWLGRSGPRPRIEEDQSIILSRLTTGILRIRYRSLYDRITARSGREGTVLVVAYRDDRYGYSTVKFSEAGLRQVYLTVRDACTRTILSGVRVSVDGSYIDHTNQQGRISLGTLSTGAHGLQLSKTGYQDSEVDTIANDEFSITVDNG